MAAVGLPATRSHDAEWLFFSVGCYISLSYEESERVGCSEIESRKLSAEMHKLAYDRRAVQFNDIRLDAPEFVNVPVSVFFD